MVVIDIVIVSVIDPVLGIGPGLVLVSVISFGIGRVSCSCAC